MRWVSPVDPAEAAVLLNQAWPLPSLEYSEELLRWQTGFPAALPLLGLRAPSGQLVALGGATARTAKLGQQAPFALPVVSFVAVQESFRGQGLGQSIYRELLSRLPGPLLTFALAGSAGAHLLERSYPAEGFQLSRLRECCIYARPLTRLTAPDHWRVSPLASPPPPPACPPDVLCPAPTPLEWEHWRRDPRGGFGVLLEDLGQTHPPLWAWLSRQRTRSAQGPAEQWVIECWAGEPLAAALDALALAVARGLCGSPAPPLLLATNLSLFPPPLLRQSGWRQISTPFSCWWASRPPLSPPPAGSCLPLV